MITAKDLYDIIGNKIAKKTGGTGQCLAVA